MHSSLSSTFPIWAVLATSAATAHIPQSILTARDAEFKDALIELYARDAVADPGFGTWAQQEAHKVGGEVKKAGSWVANHQDQIVQGVQNAATIAQTVQPFLPKKATRDLMQQEILANIYARDADADPGAGDWLKKEAGKVGNEAKKAGSWVANHQDQIVQGVQNAATIAQTVQGFLPKKAARSLAQQEILAGLYARDAAPLDDDELLELYARDAEALAFAYADPSFRSVVQKAEQGFGKAANGAEKWAGRHQDQIKKGLQVGAAVAPFLLARDAEPYDDDELLDIYARNAYAYPDPSFGSFLHNAERNVGGAVKGAEKWVGNHKQQIGQAVGTAVKIGETVAPLLAGRGLTEEDLLLSLYARDPEAEAEEEDIFA